MNTDDKRLLLSELHIRLVFSGAVYYPRYQVGVSGEIQAPAALSPKKESSIGLPTGDEVA